MLNIRAHENPVAFKAGMLSLAVHVILLIAMLVSLSWTNTKPVSIAEVELWDALPTEPVKPPPPVAEPEPVPPKPIEEPEPKPEPKPEPPEPKPEPKADIQLEKKLKEEELRKKQLELEKQKLEKQKLEKQKLEKLKQQMLQEEKLEKQKQQKEREQEALRKLQQDMLADDAPSKPTSGKPASASSAGEVDKYKAMIQAKIQRNVNQSLCGDGDPELVFRITLMPTGEVQGTPKLVQGSGLSACDDAVERAILQSQPLPLPKDASLFAQFRDLRLQFHPNQQ